VLRVKLKGDLLDVSANQGSEIRIWPGEPSYDKEPLIVTPSMHSISLMQHFGRFEGKFVIQLFNDYLIDERVLEIKPGTPRLISKTNLTQLYKKAPEGMISIPFGKFIPKHENADEFINYPDASENDTILFDSFYIDKFDVTNKEFQKFMISANYHPSDTANFLRHWNQGHIPEGRENYPVVNVSYEDARAYADWAGKRLPTEMEWQYAAQTSKSLIWPWGMKYDSTKCNPGNGIPDPVGKYRSSANPFGIQDLVGNVWQITNDIYDSESYSYIILKGGSYYKPVSSEWYVRGGPQPLMHRQALLQAGQGFERNATVGFRCVADKFRY
jgi:formylglycine-generating enzyme required for sulfatase activity